MRGCFFWGGKPAGFEYVSSAASFGELYPRILKSYAVEIAAGNIPPSGKAGMEQARKFLDRASKAGVSVRESAGRGEDVRFAGEGLIGSALAHHGEILHAVFFPDEKSADPLSAGDLPGSGKVPHDIYLEFRNRFDLSKH